MKRPSLLLALLALLVAAPSAHAAKRTDPFGVTVVRFAKGTTASQMRAVVSAAGGDVVTDLSPINALAVAPASADFTSRVRGNARVTAVFRDRVFSNPAGLDVSTSADAVPGALPTGADSFPDPWHDASSFWGVSNPEGVLQWDDARMNVPAAWRTTLGSRSVRVAVLDSGVQGSHKELLPNYDNQSSENLIPCNTLVRDYGAATVKDFGLRDCSSEDTDGHGTWVASRIAGAVNGFASNGVAPRVQVAGFKVLSTGFGGLTSWIVAGMLDACSAGFDVVNMSITGYLDPSVPEDVDDYLLWTDAAQYCRDHGAAVFAAAGNEHMRVDRVEMTLGGRVLSGVGRVSAGSDGIATVPPGSSSIAAADLRGWLEAPAGVPGVTMVSATGNAIGAAPASVPLRWTAHVGARDQLAYYSNFGSRVDLAAPGGARRYNIPSYDGGEGDILYGGWGSLGALDPSGETCTDSFLGSPFTFACFKVSGAGFGWLQGTSMSSPNVAGVAALTLSAHPDLAGHPEALVSRLVATTRKDMTNYVGPNDPANVASSLDGRPCATGYCHVDQTHPIGFSDAYGAGIVDAAASVGP